MKKKPTKQKTGYFVEERLIQPAIGGALQTVYLVMYQTEHPRITSRHVFNVFGRPRTLIYLSADYARQAIRSLISSPFQQADITRGLVGLHIVNTQCYFYRRHKRKGRIIGDYPANYNR